MWKRKIELKIFSDEDGFLAVFSKHRIDFVMVSNIGFDADELKIDIYNLDPALVGKLLEIKDKGFEFSVGYEDNESLDTLMIGKITNVWGRKAIPNHITTLWCIPASALATGNQLTKKTYKGMTAKQLALEFITDAGYPTLNTQFIGFSENDPRLKNVFNTWTVTGTFSQEMWSLAEQCNFRWSCANSYVKIISNHISANTMDLVNNGAVERHVVSLYTLKGIPELTVAHTSCTVNLSGRIAVGDVLDYSEVAKLSPLKGQSVFNVSGEGGILYRQDDVLEKSIVYNEYQIVSVTHTGSNYAPIWQTSINGTRFNTSVVAGDPESQEAAGVKGFTSSLPFVQFDANNNIEMIFPASGKSYSLDTQRRARNAMGVKFSDNEKAILQDIAGMDQQKRMMMETVLKVENQGQGEVRSDLVSNKGAVGPGQLMPEIQQAFKVTDSTDFRQSAQAISAYVDHIRERYGENFTPDRFFADYIGGPRASSKVGRNEEDMHPDAKQYLDTARIVAEGG